MIDGGCFNDLLQKRNKSLGGGLGIQCDRDCLVLGRALCECSDSCEQSVMCWDGRQLECDCV